jgi:hypothetical protein
MVAHHQLHHQDAQEFLVYLLDKLHDELTSLNGTLLHCSRSLVLHMLVPTRPESSNSGAGLGRYDRRRGRIAERTETPRREHNQQDVQRGAVEPGDLLGVRQRIQPARTLSRYARTMYHKLQLIGRNGNSSVLFLSFPDLLLDIPIQHAGGSRSTRGNRKTNVPSCSLYGT